jgi:hypothetical protein
MGVEGVCWGYTQIEANSIKEAESKAIQENQNLENFKIQEINVVLEGKIKEYYHRDIVLDCKKSILDELDAMTCSSSLEFQAGYKMAIEDVKARVKNILK